MFPEMPLSELLLLLVLFGLDVLVTDVLPEALQPG